MVLKVEGIVSVLILLFLNHKIERNAAIAASDKFCGLTFGGVSEWGCRDVALSHAFEKYMFRTNL